VADLVTCCSCVLLSLSPRKVLTPCLIDTVCKKKNPVMVVPVATAW
jgi:hypothetical protein